jgi:hypothetical protein
MFLKHNQLEKELHRRYTELEKKESQLLTELGTMFLKDWIHYYNQRESKYNQHYRTQSTKPSQTAFSSPKKASKK